MPNKSAPRKALEKLLATTKDPATRADLAVKLGALLEREGRERGRKQRAQRAKAQEEKVKAKQPQPFDGDALFELESYPPHVAAIPPKPDPLEAQRAKVEAEQKAAAVKPAAPVEEPPSDGSTRILSCMAAPWEDEPFSSVGIHPNGPQWSPWLDDFRSSNAHTNADGFTYTRRDPRTGELTTTTQREQRELREQANLWRR
jgi:hypothetical protein